MIAIPCFALRASRGRNVEKKNKNRARISGVPIFSLKSLKITITERQKRPKQPGVMFTYERAANHGPAARLRHRLQIFTKY